MSLSLHREPEDVSAVFNAFEFLNDEEEEDDDEEEGDEENAGWVPNTSTVSAGGMSMQYGIL